MAAIHFNPQHLPQELQPFLLGHPDCKAPPHLKDKADVLFAEEAADPQETPFETMLAINCPLGEIYVRERLWEYIQTNQLTGEFVMPEKYLYWSGKSLHVVTQEISLSKYVGNIHPEACNEQEKSDLEGKIQRPLTVPQVCALAEMAFLGYPDLTYDNLFFDQAGRVAIMNTEPQKEVVHAAAAHAWWPWLWFFQNSSWNTQQGLIGTAYLKTYCPTQDFLHIVGRVERNHVLWTLTSLITKAALAILAIIGTAAIIIPLAPPAALALKTLIITALAVKALALGVQGISICMVWHWSHQIKGGFPGLEKIYNAESNGWL